MRTLTAEERAAGLAASARIHRSRLLALAEEAAATESVEVRSSTPAALEVEATYGAASKAPPKHLHPDQDERFEVLAGTLRAVVGDEIGQAPGVLGCIDAHVVAACDQFAEHAAQEMRVAVVPA